MTSVVVLLYLTFGGPIPQVQPNHPVATECAVADVECLSRHDIATLTLAVMSSDRLVCARNSTQPKTCLYAYDAIFAAERREW